LHRRLNEDIEISRRARSPVCGQGVWADDEVPHAVRVEQAKKSLQSRGRSIVVDSGAASAKLFDSHHARRDTLAQPVACLFTSGVVGGRPDDRLHVYHDSITIMPVPACLT